MGSNRIFAFSILLLVFNYSTAQIMWQFEKDTLKTWYYQGGDEFNGTSINTDYWSYYLWAHSLYMNHEQQYYTSGQNHKLGDGTLKLIARRDPAKRKTVDYLLENDSLKSGRKFISYNSTLYNFTSGKLVTKQTFTKGYFECRFRIPATPGYWPAFWLHGGDPNEEIDIMESESARPHDLHVDTHCPNRCDMVRHNLTKVSFGTWLKTNINFRDSFNVVACEWQGDQVRFYINGEFVALSKVRFEVPKHLTVNLAVPSDNGPFGPGPAAEDSAGIFEIDYVRVWTEDQSVAAKAPSIAGMSKTASPAMSAPSGTLLKKRTKAYYGPKKNAELDGPKVSVFWENTALHLVTLGNLRGEAPVLNISSESGKFSYEQLISTVHSNVDINSFPVGKYVVTVTWKGKSASKAFQRL